MQSKGGEAGRGQPRRGKNLASAICISPDRARCHFKFQRKVNRIKTCFAKSQLVQKCAHEPENKLASQGLMLCNESFAGLQQMQRQVGNMVALPFFWGGSNEHWARQDCAVLSAWRSFGWVSKQSASWLRANIHYISIYIYILAALLCQNVPLALLAGTVPLLPQHLGCLGHDMLCRWKPWLLTCVNQSCYLALPPE